MLRVPFFLSKRVCENSLAARSLRSAVAALHANIVGAVNAIALQESMFRQRLFVVLLATICALARPTLAADPFSSDWADGLKSSARLIAGGPENGILQAGVEIKLAAGAITYWRNPGDSGVPPTLSFEGSSNLAQARISFPAPRRLSEGGGGEAFGYDQAVVLPIDVEPIDAAKPVAIVLKLNYAVCETICVPAEANLRLDLTSGEGPHSPFAEAIAKAKELIPRPVEWQSLASSLSATSERTWRLCLAPQAGPKRDLFIEPPEAWWFDIRPEASGTGGTDCFSLSLMQKPSDSALPIVARLTITGGQGPVETTIALKAAAKP
jgi:DsbC/DsbD-like thiol-disulfide interchange protein